MDEKDIFILRKLYENEYISGEEIASSLNISRMAINKRIKLLKTLGYKIGSLKKKGYILLDKDVIRIWEIKEYIKSSPLFKEFIYLEEVDSTNTYIKQNQQYLPDATLVYAERQTRGRGRLSRRWVDLDKGIKMSILLKLLLLDLEKIVPLTLFTGLVINRVLRKHGVESFIKWSNDIYLNGKKVCGILSELTGEVEGVGSIIIGIGINVNAKSVPEEIKDIATTLKAETLHDFDRTMLIIDILKEFERDFSNFEKYGFSYFRDEYKSFCINLRKEILVNGERMLCKDIGENGELVCEKDGKIIEISSGEVTIRF
ncbi:biotin/acetyl-CoA-carboxylase ligase [Caldicellulosiruptor owensensis OL]|uniref:Bifunctional ligase/repressor BirA n=1 Tax=Caldicellulosiruptor owensensis (strain ATCC 700167 / DSM 13100 / OL) TaxID=632518 RepID=E4Q2C6_CALOW|nr:biotin--[acetyl-CoA-carboxylase] ligase [Caldicellulosiruptor owensensis]ADQ03754.1 biotin/acetyl-CoA-carboxylase ligase [Caldicellulosiruptor owensensis OL]